MKLRVYDNQVRLRLSRGEVDRLADGNTLEERAALVPQPLVIRLASHDSTITTRFADGTLTICAPRSTMRAWAVSEAVSIAHIDSNGVRVLIEKDFQCLHGDGEDQPDCFPNPLAEASA